MAIVLRNVTPSTCLPLSREGDHEVVEGEYRNKLNCVGTGVPTVRAYDIKTTNKTAVIFYLISAQDPSLRVAPLEDDARVPSNASIRARVKTVQPLFLLLQEAPLFLA